MTDTEDDEYEISGEPPRDDQGHPIHPERGHRICGAVKSDKTTPTNHGRERDDVEYCLQAAGWGTDRDVGPCRKHPVKGEQWGESNPNFKHGVTSKFFRSKFSDRQQEVYEEMLESLDDPEEIKNLLGATGLRLLLQGEHAQDPQTIREARQLLSEFNIVENKDKMEIEQDVNVEGEMDVPAHVSNAIASAAESNLASGGEGDDEHDADDE